MSTQYADYSSVVVNRKFVWPGIFSGAFLFLAIEATFGVLGAAIFGSATSTAPNAASTSIGIGAGIWMVVLTIIALYFGGRLASTYSATATRNAGMYAGLVTFGVSIFAAFLVAALTSLATGAMAAHAGVAGAASATNFIILSGYWLFAAMILGAIAAGWGGIHGAMTTGLRTIERTTTETKRVA
jgi:hypothetical protein